MEFKSADAKYTVYEGSAPMDCAVDKWGNLFFVTKNDTIYGIDFDNEDDTPYVIAERPYVKQSQAIDVRFNDDIWWCNGNSTEGVLGVANRNQTGQYYNISNPILIHEEWERSESCTGLTVDDGNRVFFSSSTYIHTFDIKEGKTSDAV